MERFFDKVNKTDSCWNWTGAMRPNGYGCFKVKGKLISSHRFSWELVNGKISDGLLVCHKCDNRKCVNPSHLFLGSQKQNMHDCKSKNRLITPIGMKFVKGHYPTTTKIPLEEAILIKSIVKNRGSESLKSLSIRLNINYQYLRDISSSRILKNY